MNAVQIILLFVVFPLMVVVASMHFVRARREPQLRWYRYVRGAAFLLFGFACLLMALRFDVVNGRMFEIAVGGGVAILLVSTWITARRLRRIHKN
jgi:hypothetical protein